MLEDQVQLVDADTQAEVAVIGGGVAGMRAALDLADLGISVRILEKERKLGGMVARLSTLLPGGVPPSKVLDPLLFRLSSHPLVTVELGARVTTLERDGEAFLVNITSSNGEGLTVSRQVDAETVIIAAGLEPIDAAAIPELGYGTSGRVVTLLEFEEMLPNEMSWKGEGLRLQEAESVVFVQCVGSRVLRRGVPYCSAVCCASAIKNALRIKQLSPSTEVYLLYIDIRTPGREGESLYRYARERGIRFIRGQPSMVLSCTQSDQLTVCGENTLLRELYEIPADLVVLSTGLAISPENLSLLRGIEFGITEEGLPSSQAPRGIFLAGSIESPKDLWSSMEQGSAAAIGVFRYLRGERLPF